MQDWSETSKLMKIDLLFYQLQTSKLMKIDLLITKPEKSK
jgi:hypothetical protein